MVEGVGAPSLRYDTVCKLCKNSSGACVSCQQCPSTFHVSCAHSAGYTFGFDITPVKATRRDAVSTVTLNGETGSMMAAIWCKEHTPKTIVHPMNEEVEGTELIALQLFAREFKQADLTLTGTARKANLVDQSTRIIPLSVSTQGNRRTSTIANQTPTSTRGRHSIGGVVIKEEEPNDPVTSKAERKCVRCKIDASPRWWKVEEATEPCQNVPRPVNGFAPTNGDSTRASHLEHEPQREHSQPVNGSLDHIMTDAPPVGSQDQPVRLRVDTDVGLARPVSYMCQKCHWKKLNAPDEPEERERSTSVFVEPQPLPLRSPPVQPFVAPLPPPLPPPPVLGPPWVTPQQPPAMSAWHSNGPPPGPPTHGPPPHVLHNGMGLPSHPGPMNHPPPFHAPYNPVHQPNGYPAYSAPPPLHSHLPPAPPRGPYPPPHANNGGPPPPLHLGNGGMMSNGMHSPRVPYSPTHPHTHGPPRSTESPFSAPPPVSYTSMHHGSPVLGRPATPRDGPMREMPPTSVPPERISTGASASPSLRNLLH
jgi:hypothetical protein